MTVVKATGVALLYLVALALVVFLILTVVAHGGHHAPAASIIKPWGRI